PPTRARPSPVLPAVASTMVPPGASRPSASAAAIMARAGRSLREPDGFALSSLRNNRHGPRSMRVTSTRGVLPIRSRTELMACHFLRWSHFRTENRFPLFLQILGGVEWSSIGQPIDQRVVHCVRTLHGREMAAARNGDQAGAGYAGSNLLRQRGR